MLVDSLTTGAATNLGIQRFRRPSTRKRLAATLQPQGSSHTQHETPQPSALNLWNEFETIEQANHHLALMSGAMGLALGGVLLYAPLGLFSIPIVLHGTRKLHQRSWRSLVQQHKLSVSTLTSLFMLGGLAQGYYVPISLASLFYSLSCNLLLRIRDDSSADFVDIYKQFPRHARTLDSAEREILLPLEQIEAGNRVLVQAGEIIPIDGTVLEGAATIDQHILTGESQPVDRGIGDPVFALTLVLSGTITIAVEKTGSATTAAQIGQTLNQTVDYKATVQLQAEDMADKTALPTLLLSGLAFPLLGSVGALATLNAHPKFKMSLVAPIGMMNILKRAMEEGCLIKDGRSLDLLDQVDTVIFDKTGTLTEEQPHVGSIHVYNGYDESTVLMLAAAAEAHQTHPIARAIRFEATQRQLNLPDIDDSSYKIGHGLTVQMGHQLVRVGSSRFMEMEGLSIPQDAADTVANCHEQGHSNILVTVDREVVGCIELHATIRPEAKNAIAALRQRQIHSIYIISGDHDAPTKRLAEELGIDRYFAQTLPEAKAKIIQELQAEGRFVCYVGDGINDAIALKQAQVSISLKDASSIAQDTAQIILLDATLTNLDKIFDFGAIFNNRSRAAFAATFVPAIFAMGGVFLLQFGLLQTILLNQVGLIGGLLVVMRALPPSAISPPQSAEVRTPSHGTDPQVKKRLQTNSI